MKLVKEAPVFIVSSVRRSGTTLLQRLLCSSSNSLIYGENCANDINLFCNLISTKQSVFQTSKDWYDNQLDAVLQGNVNTWIPDLMPDIEGYLAAYKTGMLSIINYYSDYALKQNRPIWGMKLPEWNPCMLAMLKSVLPEIKIIYLHRNLEDCVRSAKKIEMVIELSLVHSFSKKTKHT